jgi:hypothetical protein
MKVDRSLKFMVSTMSVSGSMVQLMYGVTAQKYLTT